MGLVACHDMDSLITHFLICFEKLFAQLAVSVVG